MAPIPVYGWNLTKHLKPGNAACLKDKVAAGLNPATLGDGTSGRTDGVSC